MTSRERCYLRGVRRYLATHPDLLQSRWRQECAGKHALCGHCYVGAEALHHLLGRRCAPRNIRWEGSSHWFLDCGGRVVDPTAEQFRTTPDYRRGVGKGFLTRQPSKRAREVIAAVRRECGR